MPKSSVALARIGVGPSVTVSGRPSDVVVSVHLCVPFVMVSAARWWVKRVPGCGSWTVSSSS